VPFWTLRLSWPIGDPRFFESLALSGPAPFGRRALCAFWARTFRALRRLCPAHFQTPCLGFAHEGSLADPFVCSNRVLCAGGQAGDFDTKLEDRMNQTGDVERDHLQQQFVFLSGASLGPKGVTKDSLHG
jgi:hypothetical protein